MACLNKELTLILSEKINADAVKKLTLEEKQQLADEIRSYIIETITRTGGHLSSSLGAVELCIALHSVFSTPDDKIVFDVGHQAYAHKILTGRMEEFENVRTKGGISGFPRPSESPHDAFIGGHASISVSAAAGIAKAMQLSGDEHYVVSVIGDGALTGGEAYEGLNNAARLKRNFIVILNDNEMSISKSQGAVAAYLTQMRSSTKYFDTKTKIKDLLSKTAVGRELSKSVSGTKELVKFAIYQSNIFENLGYKYLGPVNGHSISELIEVLNVAKKMDCPCIIHIKTLKGKGYVPAELNSGAYHGVSKTTGLDARMTYSDIFGRTIAAYMKKDEKICAISAAMKYGTGLQYASKLFKDRFFDVGISEEHAVTFAAGLASQGKIPVFAVYSTFLQRCYDQLLHDTAIENYHIVLGVDRAGVVGEDGETHQGLFDVSMLSSIPRASIYSPSNSAELKYSLKKAIYDEKGIAAVRYPRGDAQACEEKCGYDYKINERDSDTLIVSYGRVANNAEQAAQNLSVSSLRMVKIFPIPEKAVEVAKKYKKIFFFEEAIKSGGIGEKFLLKLSESGFKGDYCVHAIDNCFVKAGDADDMLDELGFSTEKITLKVKGGSN